MDTTAGKEFKPQLKDGIVGKELIRYFAHFDKVPVDAVYIGKPSDGLKRGEYIYSITFEDGSVKTYKITYAAFANVLYAEPLD